jgi:lipoprotein-anchoring transpeptidase ErfK/SrfK
MRALARAAFAALFLVIAQYPAAANLVVHVDKSSQTMSVSVDGHTRYHWAVSTGRHGFGTPSGTFRPKHMARHWYSSRYYNSPMPYSIFFHKGYAIHGTFYLRQLGGPASHGCIRLHPAHAAVLFGLVRREGMGHTRIVVTR